MSALHNWCHSSMRVIANDWVEAERLQLQISQLGRDADKLKKDVRVHLPKSLFLPSAQVRPAGAAECNRTK